MKKKFCSSCSKPLEKEEDFANKDMSSLFCHFCVNSDGNVKSCEEIFAGGVRFFMEVVHLDLAMAEKITRKNMNNLPYWKGTPNKILKGPMATDQEFAAVLKSLH